MAHSLQQSQPLSKASFGLGRIHTPRQAPPIPVDEYLKFGLSPYIVNEYRHRYRDPTTSHCKGSEYEDLLDRYKEERFIDYHCMTDEACGRNWTGSELLHRYTLVMKKYGDDQLGKKSINTTLLDKYENFRASFFSQSTGQVHKVLIKKQTLTGTETFEYLQPFSPHIVTVIFVKNLVLQSRKFFCRNVFVVAAVKDVNEKPLHFTHLEEMARDPQRLNFIKSEQEHNEFCDEVGNAETLSEAIRRIEKVPGSKPPTPLINFVNVGQIMKEAKQNLNRSEEKKEEIIISREMLQTDKLTHRQKKQLEQRSAPVAPSKSKSDKKDQHKKLSKSRKVTKRQQKQGETSRSDSDQDSDDEKEAFPKNPDERIETEYGYDSEHEEGGDSELPDIDSSASTPAASTAGQKGGRKRLSKNEAKKNKKKGGMKKGTSMQSLLPETRERSKKSKDDEDDFDDVPPIEVARGDEEPRDKEFIPNFSLSAEVYTQLDKKFADIVSYLEGHKDETHISHLGLMKTNSTTPASLIEFLRKTDALLQDSYSLLDGLRVNIAQLTSSNDLNGFESAYMSCYLKYHTLRIEFSEKLENYIKYFLSMDLMALFENVIDILAYFKVKVQFTYVLGYILKFNTIFGHHDDGMFNKKAVSFRAIKAEIELYHGEELQLMADTENKMVKVMGKMNDLELLWSLYEQQVQIKLLDSQDLGSARATDDQKNEKKYLCQLNGCYKEQITSLKTDLLTEIKGFSPPFAIMKSEIERKIWTLFNGVFKEISDYMELPFFAANLNLCDRTCS